MGAVVLTVKASYIASTKYRNKSGNREVKLIAIEIINLIFIFNQADRSMENAFTRKEAVNINRSTL